MKTFITTIAALCATANAFYMVNRGVECRSKDSYIGKFTSVRECRNVIKKKGGKFLIFGTGNKKGKCYMEKTKSAACTEGFQRDAYDFYAVGANHKRLPQAEAYMIKAGHECRSKDEDLGNFANYKQCAAAVMKKKGRFFIYGTAGKKAGRCYMENTKSAACAEGWEKDSYNFYGVGDSPAVKAAKEKAKKVAAAAALKKRIAAKKVAAAAALKKRIAAKKVAAAALKKKQDADRAKKAAKTASFADFSFLESPASHSEAEAARERFLKESMRLAKERSVKVRGYFAARDQAAKMAKFEAKVQAAFKKAGNLAGAKSTLAAAAKKAHALRKKIHLDVIGKFDDAVAAVEVAKKKAAASAKVFKRYTIAAATNKALANRAAGPMKKDILALNAARKHRVSSAATLKSSGDLLKKAKNAADAAKDAYTKAALARAKASKAHAASWKASRAAILRKAAAKAAAIAAHRAVRKHAMSGWMYL